MIETKKLTKVYDGNRAVDDLDLHIEEGDIFGFLGPNGAGKSTTIFMLAGMIEPTSGEAFIDGRSVTQDPLGVKERIGVLPDDVGFYGHLTAVQNMEYFAGFYRIERSEMEKRIAELLEFVGLGDVQKSVSGYSKGMKQRLGLAQTLLNNPEVIFLDEPTAGLDPQGTHQFREKIRTLNEKEGKTIFFSSHILPEVKEVCKTIGIILEGKLIAVGTPAEIKKTFMKEDIYTILLETIDPLPGISNDAIIDITATAHRAVMKTRSDIREQLSTELYENHVRIRALELKEPDLEEIFLKSIYGGD
jgi:ABC-2 type transport system ATP-binding protein